MRTRIERLVFLPFSMGCISESSIAIGGQSPNNRSKRYSNASPTNDKDEDNDSVSEGNMKSILAVQKFQSLLKNFKNLPQLFVYKDEEVEEHEDTGLDIGFPTDVKHVTHIGIDGTSTSILSRGWDGHFTPQQTNELNAILPSEDSHHEMHKACNHYNKLTLQRAMAGENINSKSCKD